MHRHLNNEGWGCKTGSVKEREGTSGKGRLNEEHKEGESGQCIFFTNMNMEH